MTSSFDKPECLFPCLSRFLQQKLICWRWGLWTGPFHILVPPSTAPAVNEWDSTTQIQMLHFWKKKTITSTRISHHRLNHCKLTELTCPTPRSLKSGSTPFYAINRNIKVAIPSARQANLMLLTKCKVLRQTSFSYKLQSPTFEH